MGWGGSSSVPKMILYERKGLYDTGTFMHALVGIESKAVRLFEGRSLYAEGVGSTKAQRWERAWFVHGGGRRAVQLQHSDQGKIGRRWVWKVGWLQIRKGLINNWRDLWFYSEGDGKHWVILSTERHDLMNFNETHSGCRWKIDSLETIERRGEICVRGVCELPTPSPCPFSYLKNC